MNYRSKIPSSSNRSFNYCTRVRQCLDPEPPSCHHAEVLHTPPITNSSSTEVQISWIGQYVKSRTLTTWQNLHVEAIRAGSGEAGSAVEDAAGTEDVAADAADAVKKRRRNGFR